MVELDVNGGSIPLLRTGHERDNYAEKAQKQNVQVARGMAMPANCSKRILPQELEEPFHHFKQCKEVEPL